MPEPMNDERLAELRELAEENKKLTWQHPSERGVVDAVDEIARLRAELAAERKAPAGHTIPCAMGYHQNCGCACVCHTNSLPEPAQ